MGDNAGSGHPVDRRSRAKALLDVLGNVGVLGLLAWVWIAFSRLRDVEGADLFMRDLAGWIWLIMIPGVALLAGSIVGLRRAWRGGKTGVPGLVGSALLSFGLLALASCLLLTGLDGPRGWEHSGIGMRLNDRGRFDEAVPHFRKALEILGEDAEALTGLGLASTGLGDLAAARECFDRALVQEPDDPLARLGRARVRRLQGDMEGAREDLAVCLRTAPKGWIETPWLEKERKALCL